MSKEAKADAGKPHPSYVPVQGIKAVMNIREYGTQKYGNPENWRHVSFDRYHEAFLRHVMAMWNDPFAVDPESGYPHLHHVLCNGFFMAAFMEEREADGRVCEQTEITEGIQTAPGEPEGCF